LFFGIAHLLEKNFTPKIHPNIPGTLNPDLKIAINLTGWSLGHFTSLCKKSSKSVSYFTDTTSDPSINQSIRDF